MGATIVKWIYANVLIHRPGMKRIDGEYKSAQAREDRAGSAGL
jgi:hypothetical protein